MNIHGQSLTNFYSKNTYAQISLGLKHHQPLISKSPNIKIGFIPDVIAEIGITSFSSLRHGWQFIFSGSTKNYSVKLKDTIPGLYANQKEWGFSKWYYQFTINKTYNFNVSKDINSIVCAGPILYLNNQDNDSIIQQNLDKTYQANLKSIGIGINLNVSFNKKISKKHFLFLSIGYQRGFTNFLNLHIVSPYYQNTRTTANYYGSGPSIKFGLLL